MRSTLRSTLSLLMSLLLIFGPFANAAKPVELNLSSPEVQAVIKKSYRKAMDEYMVSVINMAKKNRTAADFLIELQGLPKNHPDVQFIKDSFGSAPAPRVTSTSGGLEFSSGSEKFKVSLSGFGQMKLDGADISAGDRVPLQEYVKSLQGKSASAQPLLLKMVLPEANAYAAMIGRMVWTVTKSIVKWSAIGAAAGGATGAVVGCVSGMHNKDESQKTLEACGESATGGAVIGALAGSFWAGSIPGGVGGFFDAEDKINRSDLAKYDKFKSGVGKVLKTVGVLGALVGLAHLGKELLTLNGAEIECSESNPGRYEVKAVRAGAKKSIYQSDGESLMIGWDANLKSIDDISGYLKTVHKMTDEQTKVVAQSIMDEHKVMAKTCKESPGKVYKVMSSETKKLQGEGDGATAQ